MHYRVIIMFIICYHHVSAVLDPLKAGFGMHSSKKSLTLSSVSGMNTFIHLAKSAAHRLISSTLQMISCISHASLQSQKDLAQAEAQSGKGCGANLDMIELSSNHSSLLPHPR